MNRRQSTTILVLFAALYAAALILLAPQLDFIDLRGTHVTASGRGKLAKSLPGCEILR